MEQLRRKMMKMVVMINVVSMVMMRTVRMTRPYVERASLRMSISSLSRSGKRMSWTYLNIARIANAVQVTI